eukprot:COSAG03_NODE_11904_length_571_cov_0.711864_2_plen_67_part_00
MPVILGLRPRFRPTHRQRADHPTRLASLMLNLPLTQQLLQNILDLRVLREHLDERFVIREHAPAAR